MKKFRTPSEIAKEPKREIRVPVSFRIEDYIRDELAAVAKKESLSLSELIENIIFDYYKYIKRGHQ